MKIPFLLVKVIPVFTALFTLLIVVIVSQPYDDTELRALILPKTCPMPCFMGIRPEITTMDEAIPRLERHEWVDEVDVSSPQIVFWTWSGSQPTYINGDRKGVIRSFSNNIVDEIEVRTSIPIGFVYLLLGEPDSTNVGVNGLQGGVAVSGVYFNRSIMITGILSCPVTPKKFWNVPMRITFVNYQFLRTGTGYSPIDFVC